MKDASISKSINELQREIESFAATGKSMEDVWIRATPKSYKLCSTGDDWDDGMQVFRLRIPGFLDPHIVAAAIESDGRDPLERAMRILRKPRLTTRRAAEAAHLVGTFLMTAVKLQTNSDKTRREAVRLH